MKMTKGRWLLLLGFVLIVIDQVTKILVKTNMSLGEHFNVIGDWFQILFVENAGMAFGMKFGGVVGKYILSAFRICLFAALVWWIRSLIRKGDTPTGVLVGLTLIATGALGNIIDCWFYGLLFSASDWGTVASFGSSYAPFMQGKVVDMLYFPLIDTYIGDHHITFFDPVFNIADSCVTVGAFYLVLFQWKFFNKQ